MALSESHRYPGEHGSFINILNFRDVGKTINRLTHKKLVAEGVLFRSARPDDASTSDRLLLKKDYKIKTVVDLRTKSEHLRQSQKRQADLATPTILASNDALAEPMKIPGMDYLEININGKGFERSLLKKLSVFSFIKLVFLMVVGYRTAAISILGREVMTPRGLIGLGADTLDFCGSEIAETLSEFADSTRYPILVHCTQGKDRTGIIIVLLLLLLDVPIEAIALDYRMSENELEPEREPRLVEIREMGFSDDFALCPEGWVESVRDHIDGKYGGIQKYLMSIGVDVEKQACIVSTLKG